MRSTTSLLFPCTQGVLEPPDSGSAGYGLKTAHHHRHTAGTPGRADGDPGIDSPRRRTTT
jgi:hypothetical protein